MSFETSTTAVCRRLSGLAVAGCALALAGAATCQTLPADTPPTSASASATPQADTRSPPVAAETRAPARGSSWLRRLTRQPASRGGPLASPPPLAHEHLIKPLEMPLGRRPQRLLPGYGAAKPLQPLREAAA